MRRRTHLATYAKCQQHPLVDRARVEGFKLSKYCSNQHSLCHARRKRPTQEARPLHGRNVLAKWPASWRLRCWDYFTIYLPIYCGAYRVLGWPESLRTHSGKWTSPSLVLWRKDPMKMQAGDTPATRRLHLLAGHIAPSCSMQVPEHA